MFWTPASNRGAIVALLAMPLIVAAAHGQALTTAEEQGIVVVAAKKVALPNTNFRTIRGTVLWGSLESAIQTDDGVMYPFDTKSTVAKRIYAACEVDTLCEMQVALEHESSITDVKNARKIGSASEARP